jgi:hypothetical protein
MKVMHLNPTIFRPQDLLLGLPFMISILTHDNISSQKLLFVNIGSNINELKEKAKYQ